MEHDRRKEMSEKREFDNPFPPYKEEVFTGPDKKLKPEFQEKIKSAVNKLLEKLYRGLEDDDDDSNYSVYTGTGGLALLHLHLHKKLNPGNQQYLETGLQYIKKHLRHLKGRRFTFLCGDAGPLAIGSVIYHLLKKEEKSQSCLTRLVELHERVCTDQSLPEEHLYGRVGYMYSLLFVKYHLGENAVSSSLINQVVRTVLESGQRLARDQRSTCPLMYEWHQKKYLGAAHGIAGILFLLMQIKDPTMTESIHGLIRPTIDWMMGLQYPSGNCPSSLASLTGDKLVHWCHGAPGWIYMFLQAYETFSDAKYLEAAKRCADVIWLRGLLRKGYGICHGTAGNAYAFLAMYRQTNEHKYLYQAFKFAEWCCDYGKHGCRIADTPYSLFEGMAGTIYFLVDLLDPSKSRFPAYEL